MANKVVPLNELEEIKHYGVLGMKWGIRRANSKTASLSKQVNKTVRKYDKGKDVDTTGLSKRVRKEKYKVERGAKKAKQFIAKSAKADAKQIINRYNKNPAKKELTENYIKSMNLNSTTLAELRMQLIDIRV